jgi:hypothetical protein
MVIVRRSIRSENYVTGFEHPHVLADFVLGFEDPNRGVPPENPVLVAPQGVTCSAFPSPIGYDVAAQNPN